MRIATQRLDSATGSEVDNAVDQAGFADTRHSFDYNAGSCAAYNQVVHESVEALELDTATDDLTS
jgi:hypothetical protein